MLLSMYKMVNSNIFSFLYIQDKYDFPQSKYMPDIQPKKKKNDAVHLFLYTK